MEKIIKNKTILITWDPWSGKTFLCSFFAYHYFINKQRIFSNIDFFYKKNPNRINKKIQKIQDIKYIEFQEQKGIIIIDEAWINANSRRSMSDKNLEFNELTFLWRKKNCDIIYIAQLWFSVDKYIRELATITINMMSYFISNNYLMYVMEIKKKDYLVWFKEIDLIRFSEECFFSYCTLESSKIESEKEVKKREKQEKNWQKKIL